MSRDLGASAFSHFDMSNRENFCAAVLLLTMELDDTARAQVADLVRTKLKIDSSCSLTSFGREARLEQEDDRNYARVDLWLRFESSDAPLYAFIEVKTRNSWCAQQVADQVRDQSSRKLARTAARICGCLLLAPDDLCRRVQRIDNDIRAITWADLLQTLHSPSLLTNHAIRHLDEQMDHPPGLDRGLSLTEFEQATTTIACLREFLNQCAGHMEGRVQGDPLYLTPGDGRPRRRGSWAWHGLSLPFTLSGQKGRVGIYKYADAPPTDADARDSLWLEVYLGDDETPAVFVKFAPPTLAAHHLRALGEELKLRWESRPLAAAAGRTES